MKTANTAAGIITVLDSGRCEKRGGTTLWIGLLSDGRFVLTSRFQVELRTGDEHKAFSHFRRLCDG